jgi:hypothetical protein
MERRDAAPYRGRMVWEASPGPTPLHKLGHLLHVSLSSAGFVTALSDRFRSGGRFPASSLMASILPGLLQLDFAGEIPSLREGDRYFRLRQPAQQPLTTMFPVQET